MRNTLALAKSTYLLQHADDPVWWQEWGQAAFEAAKAENKPLFVSAGYSSCYWCHVMHHDSFSDASVAEVLNREFICIKVDREELPDVDDMLMDVVVGMHGHGGWPLTVFLTPDGRPFWGTTFLYRDQFLAALSQLADTWHRDREAIDRAGSGIVSEILGPMRAVHSVGKNVCSPSEVRRAVERFLEKSIPSVDSLYGGFGGAPKFPQAPILEILERITATSRLGASVADMIPSMIDRALEGMLQGGIHDHVGGGFHRYSVDRAWTIPHFEKMLVDNALLASIYRNAWCRTKRPEFLTGMERALDWMDRELSIGGGLACALDAGAVGHEGDFYGWRDSELEELLSPEEITTLKRACRCPAGGNFERGMTILSLDPDFPLSQYPTLIPIFDKLRLRRDTTRTAPQRDGKVLVGWNGLALSAFAGASACNQRFAERARQLAQYLHDRLYHGEALVRRGYEDSWGVPAQLEDYSYLIQGLLDAGVALGEEAWIQWALRLQSELDVQLWDDSVGRYRSDRSWGIAVQSFRLTDSAAPNPNAVALSNVVRLSRIFGDSSLGERGEHLAASILKESERYPFGCATGVSSLLELEYGRDVIPVGMPGIASSQEQPYAFPGVTVWKVPSGGGALPLLRDKQSCKDPGWLVCSQHGCRGPFATVQLAISDVAQSFIRGSGLLPSM